MPKTYQFTEAQIAELKMAKKKNKNKNVDKRIETLLLRASGLKRKEVSDKTSFSISHITEIISRYQNEGLCAIVDNHYWGNHRNLSFEEEAELLQPFMESAKTGQLVEVSEILQTYETKMGRTFEKSHGQIYSVLERHGWRKVMPRSKHPNKASDEVIETSKKLTLN